MNVNTSAAADFHQRGWNSKILAFAHEEEENTSSGMSALAGWHEATGSVLRMHSEDSRPFLSNRDL